MLVVGTGNFTKDILPSLEAEDLELIFYDLSNEGREDFLGYDCLSTEEQVKLLFKTESAFIVCVGDPSRRREICSQMEKLGGENVNFVSSKTMIGNSVRLAKKGIIIMGMSYIADDVTIEEGVIIYCHCGVGHGSHLEAYCMLSSHVVMSAATLGANCFVGIGVKFKPGVKIGKNCLIGMGSIVTKDFPESSLLLGVPARSKRKETL